MAIRSFETSLSQRKNDWEDVYQRFWNRPVPPQTNPPHVALPRGRVDGTKITYVTFGTLGPPHDSGSDMSESLNRMRTRAEELGVKNVVVHSPHTIKQLRRYDERFLRSFPDMCIGPNHSRGCRHGFWAWKSLVVYDTLLNADTEFVIYTDCNCLKYPYLYDNFDVILNFAVKWDEDVAIATEFCAVKDVVKPSVRALIPESEHNRRSLHANVIILKKNQATLDLMEEWMTRCLTSQILPETKNEKPNVTLWHTHDQAILTTLVYERGFCKKPFYTSDKDEAEWTNIYRGEHPENKLKLQAGIVSDNGETGGAQVHMTPLVWFILVVLVVIVVVAAVVWFLK
mgnify:CR=1 FL=1